LSQEIGTTQTGRAGSNHGYPLALGLGEGFRLGQFIRVVEIPVCGEALELPYGYWVVEFTTAAACLTGVMADATADGGEWVSLPDGLNSIQVLAGGNMGYIFGYVDAHRAGMLAGGIS